jgi:hypothetical protein
LFGESQKPLGKTRLSIASMLNKAAWLLQWHTASMADRQLSTYLRQVLRQAANQSQLLHTLKHGVVLLSGKQCRHCSQRAVCVAANKS